MSKPIKDLTNEELVEHLAQWRQDSIADTNGLVSLDKPMTDIAYLAAVTKGLHDDVYYLLGYTEELSRRLLKKEHQEKSEEV